MKIKSRMIAAAVVTSLMSAGAMADAGSGTVTFIGTVSDAPCNIAAESVDQTVPFGLVSKSYLNADKEVMKNFQIKLEQCDTSLLKKASITFYGPGNATGAEIPALGVAKNVAIRLASANTGKAVIFGTKVDNDLQSDTNILRFTAYVKKAAGATTTPPTSAPDVTEGEFRSIADFRMSYQ